MAEQWEDDLYRTVCLAMKNREADVLELLYRRGEMENQYPAAECKTNAQAFGSINGFEVVGGWVVDVPSVQFARHYVCKGPRGLVDPTLRKSEPTFDHLFVRHPSACIRSLDECRPTITNPDI